MTSIRTYGLWMRAFALDRVSSAQRSQPLSSRNSFNSSGGRSHTSAALVRLSRRISTLRCGASALLTARKALSSVRFVAKIAHRPPASRLREDGIDRATLVAPYPQVIARLELEQRQPFHPRQRLEERTCLALDQSCLLRRTPAPVHHRRVGLVSNSPPRRRVVIVPTSSSFFCRLPSGFLQFPSPIGIETLGAMQTPHLKRGSSPSSDAISAAGAR